VTHERRDPEADDAPPSPTPSTAQGPPSAAKPVTPPVIVLASGVTEKGRMLYEMYEKRFGKPAGN
jgi:hypothetical protein